MDCLESSMAASQFWAAAVSAVITCKEPNLVCVCVCVVLCLAMGSSDKWSREAYSAGKQSHPSSWG